MVHIEALMISSKVKLKILRKNSYRIKVVQNKLKKKKIMKKKNNEKKNPKTWNAKTLFWIAQYFLSILNYSLVNLLFLK